jgi:GxxExxY protein
MGELIFREQSYEILGSCFEVYKEKGCGFLEAVYQECLELEFNRMKIPFTSRTPLKLEYKGLKLEQFYIPDFICYGTIILEIKAVKALSDEHRAQTINYIKATKTKLGLLVNFGHYPKIEFERFPNLLNLPPIPDIP